MSAAAASLGPMPHSKDIGYIPAGTTGPSTSLPAPPRDLLSLSVSYRLIPGMRNSAISRGTPRGPRDTWTLEDEDNRNDGSPDEASEVRRLPRPREEARIASVFREREGIELSSLEIIDVRWYYLDKISRINSCLRHFYDSSRDKLSPGSILLSYLLTQRNLD